MSAVWLFSRRVDLWAFGGSFVLSLVALALGAALGVLQQDTPNWAWVPAVLLCDVAHVWSTAYVSYGDRQQRQQRAGLLWAVPLLGLLAGVALHALGAALFWRALAYLAMFHFVRQQYGWMKLYRARAGDNSRAGAWIDGAAIYLATLFPLFFWHARGRSFSWFVAGDVVTLSQLTLLVPYFAALYTCSQVAYLVRAALDVRAARPQWGKHLLWFSTVVLWLLGMVVFDSDYAFTVTNVFAHGIPYVALVWQQKQREKSAEKSGFFGTLCGFVALLWLLAFVEEALWDRMVWHDRPWLFGEGWELSEWHVVLVPLLALPQLTHYVLDGFLWRRKKNPELHALVARSSERSER